MKKNYFGILLVLLSLNCFSQTPKNYTGEWGIAEYDTLTNYTSLLYEVLPTPSLYWGGDLEVDIGFPFPYFDQIYTQLAINGQGYVFFGFNWYEIYVYAAHYERHQTLPIFSDWRMQRDTVGMDILKFEWKDIGVAFDIQSPTPTDHRMNFQLWLYENGIIEYHFGNMDLANTPWYSNLHGFTLPTGESVGPWVSIKRRMIEEEYFFLCNNDSIQWFAGGALTGDIYHCVPEYGTYMRFIPNEVTKTTNIASNDLSFMVMPNPVEDKFFISMPHKINLGTDNPLLEIHNQTGAKVFSERINLSEAVDISTLRPGYYTVTLLNESGRMYNSKLIKK